MDDRFFGVEEVDGSIPSSPHLQPCVAGVGEDLLHAARDTAAHRERDVVRWSGANIGKAGSSLRQPCISCVVVIG
jgi:hypothetical protein